MLKACERLMNPGKAKVDYMKAIHQKSSAGGQDEKRLVEKIQKVMAERELNAALTK
jgi:hypothetical protein